MQQGSSSLMMARKNIGVNQKIVLMVIPAKKATPRRFRKNDFTVYLDCGKKRYFSPNRDTVII